MPNSITRLKKIFSEFGFDVENDKITNAEIESYAAGIKLIEDDFGVYIKRIFPDPLFYVYPYEYRELVGDYLKANGRVGDTIKSRIGGPWGSISAEEIAFTMYLIKYSMTYEIEDGKMIMDGFGNDGISMLGHFIRGYVPASLTPDIDGMPSNFGYWDNWKKKWYVLDRMELPFNIIDKMRVYLYE